MTPHVLLASTSPRRRRLLAFLGVEYEAVGSGVDESEVVGADPAGLAVELARRKALAVRDGTGSAGVVVGADTVVALDGRPLGQSDGDAAARSALAAMRGRTVEVVTGVVVASAELASAIETTRVEIAPFSAAQLDRYIELGAHRGKAGGLSVQHHQPSIVTAIHGCPTNALGLPLCVLAVLLRAVGVAAGEGACATVCAGAARALREVGTVAGQGPPRTAAGGTA